jgi:perosamine synthetase
VKRNEKMMSNEFIMQMRPLFGPEEKRAIFEYMEEDGFLTEFKRTADFENRISEYVGSKHCIVVNNGTISLTLAALAVGIGIGDEVIVPNYTMIATPNSLKMIGATTVFVDVEPETLCLNIDLIKKAITPKTKAIYMVSANGRFPNAGIKSIEKFAQERNLFLIEDAAQSLGSFYPDGRHVGRAGLIGSFSFSAPKIISTGQGGALITDDDEIAFKLRRLKDFGRSSGGNDIHDSIGYNFKFTELQACIGIEQMKKLPARVIRKKEIWARYKRNLKNLCDFSLFDHDLKYTTPWFIDAKLKNRDNFAEYLLKRGVGTRKMYPPINTQLAYSVTGDFPVSRDIGEHGIWLPSYIQLTDAEIDRVCELIISFFNND